MTFIPRIIKSHLHTKELIARTVRRIDTNEDKGKTHVLKILFNLVSILTPDLRSKEQLSNVFFSD
jgi:hypothetical protein